MPATIMAQTDNNEPYAVLSENNKVLTFYYDDQKDARGGLSVGPFESYGDPGWYDQRESITKVVFDDSFANCTTLTSTAEWFDYCSNLTTIIGISNLKTDNVTDMRAMFGDCSGLTSLDLSNFKTDNVTNISGMFRRCSGLKSLDLSSFKTDNVTMMNTVFYFCTGLTTIYVSGKWSTRNVTMSNYMFHGCSKLVGGMGTKYDLSGTNDCTYAHIDEGTSNPGYFTQGSISSTSTPYAVLSDDNSVLTFYFDDQKEIRGGMSVGPFDRSYLDVSWYDQRESITKVVFDDSFADCTTLTSTAAWFSDCVNLKTIVGISNLKTSNVTKMTAMFNNCYKLTNLDLSGFNTSNVTSMQGMFFDCLSLTSLDLSSFRTDKVTDMELMFSACQSLKKLDISSFNTKNVVTMFSMFNYCDGLTTIYVGDGWSTANVMQGSNMFDNCTSLVGGLGTAYDANHTDYTYAHIDEGPTNPGYFTQKGVYYLSITATGNGSAKYNNNVIRNKTSLFSVAEGSSVTITLTSDNGYRVKSLIVNRADVKSSITNNQYTISNVTANSDVEVEFEAIQQTTYTLSIKATGSGSVAYGETIIKDNTKTFTVKEGASATITLTPDEGYRVKALSVNSTDVTSSIADNQYNISSINENTNVEAEFEIIPPVTYALSIKAIGKGSVTYGDISIRESTSSFSVDENSSATITLTPDEGYRIKSLMVNSTNVTSDITGYQYTIDVINANTTIEAEFRIKETLTNDEIVYKVVSEDDKTVKLAKGDYGLCINVPEKFTAYDIEWTIIGVEKGALDDLTELAAIVWNPGFQFNEEVSNPNLLLYVKSKDCAPAVDNINVIIDNTAKKITLKDGKTGYNFYCPKTFTAEQITYEHNYCMKTGFYTSQGWESIALPFDVALVTNQTGTQLVPYALWKLGDNTRPFWLYGMNEDGWKQASAIKANTPYVISMPNNENYNATYIQSGDVKFSASNVEVKASDELANSKWGHRILVPNYQTQKSSSDIYALNVNNSIYTYTESDPVEGSAFIKDLRDVGPFEAYVMLDSNSSATRCLSIFGDDDTTDIMDLPTSSDHNGNNKVYSLSGRLIKQGKDDKDLQNLPKGVYIINGKKVIK